MRRQPGDDPDRFMVVSTVVTAVGVPVGVKVAVYLVSLVAAIAGFVLNFRDYG